MEGRRPPESNRDFRSVPHASFLPWFGVGFLSWKPRNSNSHGAFRRFLGGAMMSWRHPFSLLHFTTTRLPHHHPSNKVASAYKCDHSSSLPPSSSQGLSIKNLSQHARSFKLTILPKKIAIIPTSNPSNSSCLPTTTPRPSSQSLTLLQATFSRVLPR